MTRGEEACARTPRTFQTPGPQRLAAQAQPHTLPPQAAEDASWSSLCGGQSLCLTLVSAQGRWEAAQGTKEPSLPDEPAPRPREAGPACPRPPGSRQACGPVGQVSHLLYQSSPGRLFAAPEDGDAHREGS